MKPLTLATVAFLAMSHFAAANAPIPVGRTVKDFSLKDFRGTAHALADVASSKLVVIAFLGTECPLAKLYGPRLAELAEEYQSRGVTFLGINANRQDSVTEIAAYARDSQIKFPILKDPGNVVADQLCAMRTPEVFVLDEHRVVRYWGRIDDRYGIGYAREASVKNHLQDALDQLLAGKAVEPTSVESVGCRIGRVRPPVETSKITYSNQIARIFQDRCVQCHRTGEIAPFALTDYSEVPGWADTIAEVVRDRRMPPWHASKEHGRFRNDVSLSDVEKDQILQWAAAGAPEGNPKELPEPRKYVEGWTLPRQPDKVVTIHEEPFAVPANGEVRYQFFTVDPGFTEGKWIKASQIVPGEPSVVHHVLCFVQPADGPRRESDENGLGFLSAYVPGYRATPYPDGMAKYVPAGSKLRFQMHYTPAGKAVEDVSKIGIVFAKPSELTHMVQTVSTGNRGFAIPPRTDNYRAEATMPPYKHDLRVLSYSPHMHLRGKAFRYEAVYPDGNREILLDVPRYDFNWQTSYELAEAKILPTGTRVHCVAHWDNSESNLANPDPSSTVRWGDQTWEEMMIGFFDVAIPIDREKLLADGIVPRLEPVNLSPQERAEELISQFDSNGDVKLTADEMPGRFASFFSALDTNKDGSLDKEEVMAISRLRGALGGRGGQGQRDGGPSNPTRGEAKSPEQPSKPK